MKLLQRLTLTAVIALPAVGWGDPSRPGLTRASPSFKPVVIAQNEVPPQVIEETIIEEESAPRPLPPELSPTPVPVPGRGVVCNPRSRVIQGPLVRRIVPSRYARPFNKGYYRYEPRLGDIRNLPRDLTLPGSEGERETLYSLPPRDRGYFVLPRW